QSQPWTIKNRVSVVGWANGGVASLWAVQPHAVPKDGVPDFRSAVAFYPGAYHEFDRPDYPVREVTGLANTADGSGRAHIGTNAAARTDALMRVPEWLAR